MVSKSKELREMAVDFQIISDAFQKVYQRSLEEGDLAGQEPPRSISKREINEKGQLEIRGEFLSVRRLRLTADPIKEVIIDSCTAEHWPSIINFYNISTSQLTHISLINCQLTDDCLWEIGKDVLLKSRLLYLCLGNH